MPDAKTPSLFDLIANDQELQDMGTAVADFLKGALLGNTTDLVGAPVQILGDALNAVGVPVGPKPVGGTNWLREKLGQKQPTDESLAQTLGSLVGMPDPQSAVTLAGLAGALRKGGNQELVAWHNSDPKKLAELAANTPVLSNPSIGISKFDPFQFGGSDAVSLLFKPSEHLDPALTRGHLYNRDAYTTRVRANIADAFDDIRFSETAAPREASHLLSIAASPKFRSLKEFEESPTGAAILTTPKQKDKTAEQYEALGDRLAQSAYGDEFVPSTALARQQWARDMIEQMQGAPDNTGLGAELLKALQTNPSDYAELKKLGDMPLNSSTLGGVLLPPSFAYDYGPGADAYARQLEDLLQVPVGTAQELLQPAERTRLMEMASWLATQLETGHGNIRLTDEGRRMLGRIRETPASRAFLPYDLRYQKDIGSRAQAEEAFLKDILVSPWLSTMKARQLTKD